MLNPPYYLQLMIGPGVPVPVGTDIINALVSVSVTNNTEGPSIFQLSFNLSTKSPLHTLFLLTGGSQLPIMRVVILVVVNGMPNVLMDGVITNQQVQPGSSASVSTLTVTGEDLSKLMDYIPLDGVPYPAMDSGMRVLAMLAKYMAFGIVPAVVPAIIPNVTIPTDEIPRQQGTDLAYIKYLAEKSGYEFYVDPGPFPLQSIAYWGPSIRIGVHQPWLNTDMGPLTNVQSMSFNFDAEHTVLPIVMIYPKQLKVGIPIPIPNFNPLAPPLALIPPIPKNIEIDRDSARKKPGQALLAALARAAKTADAASAKGTLQVSRYGQVLKARKLVGVRGAGAAFDGLYFVKSVTHKIEAGKYDQDFELIRNGLVASFT
jgi:hypothetical protein